MKARAVSLRSSPPPFTISHGCHPLTHCPSWLSLSTQRPSRSPSSAHRRTGLSPSSLTVPQGCHSLPLSAPRGRPPPLTAERGGHPHHSLSLGAVSLPSHCSHGRHPLPLTPPLCVPSGRLPPLPRVLIFSLPAPSSPALSPWRADPWLPTPLPPPLKPPPLDNQSGPGRGQKRPA